MLWIIVCVDGNFPQSIMNVNILAPFAHKMLKKGGQQFQPIPETGHVFISRLSKVFQEIGKPHQSR